MMEGAVGVEGSAYLQGLIRYVAATPAVTAAAVVTHEPHAELDLYLTAPDGLPTPLPEWLAPLGETAFLGADEIITGDGLTIRVWVNHPAPAGAQVLFGAPAFGAVAAAMPDLAAAAARFWRGLYHACGALGQEQPLTAHGRLEACRTQLLDLYRLALAPGRSGNGWAAMEALPGAAKVLEGLTEWLVAPLELRAQWRCAFRLAEAYEQLMLPLAERLHLAYPWAMRNLAFRRLDEIRPDKAAGLTGDVPRLRDAAEEPAPRPGKAKVKVRVRRPE
jgi:hypothetical protein